MRPTPSPIRNPRIHELNDRSSCLPCLRPGFGRQAGFLIEMMLALPVLPSFEVVRPNTVRLGEVALRTQFAGKPNLTHLSNSRG